MAGAFALPGARCIGSRQSILSGNAAFVPIHGYPEWPRHREDSMSEPLAGKLREGELRTAPSIQLLIGPA